MLVQTTLICSILHLGRSSQERDSVMPNFRERLRTLGTGLWDRSLLRRRFIRCVFRDDCRPFFALSAVLASEVAYARKTIDGRRLAPDSWIYPVPAAHPIGFCWAMFFCQNVTDHCTLTGSADSPLFICRDHSAPALLGGKRDIGSLGFRWWYADYFRCSGSRRRLH